MSEQSKMTNEEAFEKFWEDRQAKGLDAANMREYEESWNAAISYMQEQSKEVVEAIRERDRLWFAVVNVIGKLDEIIENTQEIEIDDFLHIAISIDMWNELEAALEDMPKRADLYTSPQPRDWVSLTTQDRQAIIKASPHGLDRINATEAKCKQLNTKG